MPRKTLLAMGYSALLLGAGAFYAMAAKPSCCHKPAPRTATATNAKLRCSLTGKVVDRCCCVEREGKLHCTLANKDVATCCCGPAETKKAT